VAKIQRKHPRKNFTTMDQSPSPASHHFMAAEKEDSEISWTSGNDSHPQWCGTDYH
jgi:hypothetical protein